jgi:hypothetical protein
MFLYFIKHTPHTRYNYYITRLRMQLLNLTVCHQSKHTNERRIFFQSDETTLRHAEVVPSK